jgi:hypothetical protein
MPMRPTLQVVAEQQKMIEGQQAEINALRAQASRQAKQLAGQGTTIERLGRGLFHLASMAGSDVQSKVASAMLRTADSQNPAQPVPEPPAGPPTETTQETETPEAFANVQDPGLVPGSTNDVAADATTTAYTPGMDIGAPAFHQLVDVTQPVDGTQNPRPLEETKTLTDVRVGDPMNAQTAFPLQGEFQNAQRTSSKTAAAEASRRTMAALRLARLRLQAGTSQGDSDIAVATTIEKDASLSTAAIEMEISTLESVKNAATKRAASARLVPKAANRQARPSMQGTPHTGSAAPIETDTADADLFD